MNTSSRLLLLLLAFAPPMPGSAVAAEQRQPLRAGNLEVFYGVMPAEAILGHPEDHSERKMHDGVPRGAGQHHLIVSLFDGRTRERVTDATVRARVTEPGLTPQRKTLEAMTIAGAITYGNYFRMSGSGPYRVEIEIIRPGATGPVKATFEYSHPRR